MIADIRDLASLTQAMQDAKPDIANQIRSMFGDTVQIITIEDFAR